MAKNNSDQIDFHALQEELNTINAWFETPEASDPSLALEKYRRSVEIVKEMKAYLVEVENEFKVISNELEQES